MTLQPLDGVKVIDFSQVMLGPCATQMLGDYGAEVIKIERPHVGDLSRTSMGDAAGGNNAVFASLNRNKRSITIDLHHDGGRQVVLDLIRRADVLMHNFRPGVMERRGLGFEELHKLNPRLIYAVGSGFGPSGPYAHKGGQDTLAQALTGVMARRADPAHPLAIYATALADYSAGMHLALGVLLALMARERSGSGQRVDCSLYDSMLSMQMQEATVRLMDDAELNWAAYPLSGAFETTDGALVLVGAFKENPLRLICEGLGIEDLSTDDRYSTFERCTEHRAELHAIFRRRFATASTDHWIGRLEAHDLLCAPVRTLAEALEDPQTKHNEMLLDIELADGSVLHTVGSPIHLSETPARPTEPPPRLGQDTEEVLTELGYGSEQIDALRREGAFG